MTEDNEPPKSRISGWARRTTGLPGDVTPVGKTERKGGDPGAWRIAGLGLQFAVTVVLFTFFGMVLDEKLGWSPWGVVVMVSVAVVGNLYLLIKESMKEK